MGDGGKRAVGGTQPMQAFERLAEAPLGMLA